MADHVALLIWTILLVGVFGFLGRWERVKRTADGSEDREPALIQPRPWSWKTHAGLVAGLSGLGLYSPIALMIVLLLGTITGIILLVLRVAGNVGRAMQREGNSPSGILAQCLVNIVVAFVAIYFIWSFLLAMSKG
jgi:hypothetical protein